MTNPQYLVTISWYPIRATGQAAVYSGGVTSSVFTYSGGYYVSSMPELRGISSTGSTYVEALNNLLLVASASIYDGGYPPINNTRT